MTFEAATLATAPNDEPLHLHLLRDLVAFDTVSRNSNLALIDYVERMLGELGAKCERIFNHQRNKANLLASFGPVDRPGIVLSGHTDVVPVDGQPWSSDPFALALRDGRAYGRGTADMKGFAAVCLSLAHQLSLQRLDNPIHIALSYDEELGCLGAPSLAQTIMAQYGRQEMVIVGEPTQMQPVIGHKANTGVEVTVKGRAAHSSLAPTTINAVEVAGHFLQEFSLMQAEAAALVRDDLYDVPVSTITVTQIEGGSAINIVPVTCRIVCEFRLLPPISAVPFLERLQKLAAALMLELQTRVPEADIRIREIFSYPGLDTSADESAVAQVMRAAGSNAASKVAYGTEAGLFSQITGTPTVIIGPGSIEQAHKPDEFVDIEQLEQCRRFLVRLLRPHGAASVDRPEA